GLPRAQRPARGGRRGAGPRPPGAAAAAGGGRGAPRAHPRGPAHRDQPGGGDGGVRVHAPPGRAGGLRRARGGALPGLRGGAAVARLAAHGEPGARGEAAGREHGGGAAQLQEGAGEGADEDPVQDGHQPAVLLPRRPDLRGLRPGAGGDRRGLRGHGVAHRGPDPGRRPARDGGLLGQGLPGEEADQAGGLRLHPGPAQGRAPRQQPGHEQAAAQGHRPGRARPRGGGRLRGLPPALPRRAGHRPARPAGAAHRGGGRGRGGGGVRGRHRGAVLHGGDEPGRHQPRDARDHRHRHEPAGREEQLGRGRGGPRALAGAGWRGQGRALGAAAPPQGAAGWGHRHLPHQAGGLGPVRRDPGVPGQRRPGGDQDRAGRQA
ncbi:hypothetical protein APUTEX25_005380, partial [Auxenochlorella protothecoides]